MGEGVGRAAESDTKGLPAAKPIMIGHASHGGLCADMGLQRQGVHLDKGSRPEGQPHKSMPMWRFGCTCRQVQPCAQRQQRAEGLSKGSRFSKVDPVENMRGMSDVARLFVDACDRAAYISPFR